MSRENDEQVLNELVPRVRKYAAHRDFDWLPIFKNAAVRRILQAHHSPVALKQSADKAGGSATHVKRPHRFPKKEDNAIPVWVGF